MPVDLSSIYGGYQSASRFNPVEKRTLENVLKRYKLTFAGAKGKSDVQLRQQALASVLRKRNLSVKPPKLGRPRTKPNTRQTQPTAPRRSGGRRQLY